MEDLVVKFERKGSVALLTLNRPQVLNAINEPMIDIILEKFKEIEDDGGLGSLVIEGAGKAFCSGHDLREILQASPLKRRDLFTKSIKIYEDIAKMSKPVIAAVHGYTVAAGCGLAAACDIAVASEDAVFQTPGVNIGMFCLTPMIPLQRAIGRKKAMEMLITGDPIGSSEAEKLGLVNRVVPKGKHVEVALEFAEKISGKSRVAYGIGKPAFYLMGDMEYLKALHYAKDLITLASTAEDAEEGMRAILEKRMPEWRNR
ncbi:enoyl-CoA hydratase/isomerase family protein [Candidatus Bathyarchaeota archaeon]|nr:enoyl-CoA hydratase/isomerase family protein [Candidatus Bathyarchaeota archaeon]